ASGAQGSRSILPRPCLTENSGVSYSRGPAAGPMAHPRWRGIMLSSTGRRKASPRPPRVFETQPLPVARPSRVWRRGDEMTQLEYARKGEIPPQMAEVAQDEGPPPEELRTLVASGEVVIPRNVHHEFRAI